MVARVAGLGAATRTQRWWAQWARLFAAGDMDALRTMYAPDAWLVDHRPFGYLGELHGADDVLGIARTSREAGPDVRFEVDETLACDDRVIALRCAFRGHGIKAGEFESPWCLVTVVEDGLLLSLEVYEPDDPEAALARYAELTAG
jgi:ketosteroid isomerase-like protein